LRLFGNLIDNAIKETDKIKEVESKQIMILFKNVDGYFSFETIDNAKEFKIEILKRIGERKNSINGTGNGYSEIIEILEKSDASLIIDEWYDGSEFGKKISVVFDDMKLFIINSSYRYNELADALVASKLKILDIE